MITLNQVNVTQHLAARLLHIISEQGDYRRRVDAIASTLLGRDDTTARTALLIALASVSPQPAQNWPPRK